MIRMIRSNRIIAVSLFLVFISLSFGCGSPPLLKVGTLAVIDSLPLSLARHKPIFAENNLVVEPVYMKNALELRSALIHGRVDAVITDLVGALLLNQGEERGKIVRVALDDKSLRLGQTVIFFSQRMVNEKPALIRRFLRAYEQSVRELNVRPEVYRFLALETVRPSSEMIAHVTIPIFPFPGEVPTESDIESANAWLLEKKMVLHPISYQQGVNPGFLWDPYQFKPASCCGW